MVLAENVSGIGVVVGDIMAVGFKMAGVPHVHTDPAMVRTLLDRKDLGVLIMTSKVFEALDADTKSRVLSSLKPAVVVLDADEGRMKEYIKKLTGVEVG
jgi:vacuolar-type H+-ATPase subunit F/Vma7